MTDSPWTLPALDDRNLARLGFWSLSQYAPAFFAQVETALGEVWRAEKFATLTPSHRRRLAPIARALSLPIDGSESLWRERLTERGYGELRALGADTWAIATDSPACASIFAAVGVTAPFLFGRGDAESLTACPSGAVAVVGSRVCESRWHDLAFELAEQAADLNLICVSGGAVGVDTAAHSGAVAAGGRTLVVLPVSLTRTYPAQNRVLFDRVVDSGGLLVSPFAPSHVTHRRHFVLRNTWIAAAARLTIVVRAGAKSGSLQTARVASRLGRPLATVPGDLLDPGAAGCNHLLRSGAVALTDPSELAAILDTAPPAVPTLPLGAGGHQGVRRHPRHRKPPTPQRPTPPGLAGEIVAALADHPRLVDELSRLLKRPPSTLAGPILELELSGYVVRDSGTRLQLVGC